MNEQSQFCSDATIELAAHAWTLSAHWRHWRKQLRSCTEEKKLTNSEKRESAQNS